MNPIHFSFLSIIFLCNCSFSPESEKLTPKFDDVQAFEQAIATYEDVDDITNEYNESLLTIAIAKGKPDIAKILLLKGADPLYGTHNTPI